MPTWKKTLTIMFVSQLLSAVGFSMIFPFLPGYIDALGSHTGFSPVFLAGAVFSAQAITMMIASPFWGALADRVGRKPMVQRALFGGAIVIFLMAFVRSAEELVLLRAVQGLITGVVAAGNALVASVAPKEKSGYAMGLMQTALWSGVAVGPIMGGVLADVYGFEAAFIVTAVLLLFGGVLVQFGVKESFTPRTGGGAFDFVDDWKHLFATHGVSATFLARFTAQLGRGILVPILPLFVPTLLVSSDRIGTFTGLVIGVAAATGTLSAIVLGKVGDRVGHKRVLSFAALAAALVYLPMAFVTHPWQLLLLNAVAGLAIGGVMPSLSALLTQYSEQNEVGSAFGIDNAVIAASRAVAPLLGVGIAQAMGFRSAILAGGAVFLVTLALSLWKLPSGRRSVPATAGD